MYRYKKKKKGTTGENIGIENRIDIGEMDK